MLHVNQLQIPSKLLLAKGVTAVYLKSWDFQDFIVVTDLDGSVIPGCEESHLLSY